VKLLSLSASLLTAALCLGQSATTSPTDPEVIYFHGNVLTGVHLRTDDTSATPSNATAIAIDQGKIIAVGNDANILRRKSPATKIIDLHGAFVMPGFIDAHTHIASAGQQKLTIDLDGTKDLKEMQQRIHDYTAKQPAGAWLQGGGWDHTKWPTKTLPTRQDIDAVSSGHPAVLERTDGHILIANTAALAAAHITRDTPDPAGGKIDRDADGNPTGIVREGPATSLLFRIIPPPTTEQRRKALLLAQADALSHGVTSVEDLSSWDDFLVLESLEKSNQLHLRVSEWLAFDTPVETLKQHRSAHPQDDPLLHTGMLKGFMDGSLGSRTAALAAPYSDDPKNSGIPRYDQPRLNTMAKERAEAGFQLGFHAIGDRANHMALEAFTFAGVIPVRRFRIEHAQVLLPADFDLYQKLGIIASMQPSHLLTDMNWAEARLGPERAKYSYAWRSMLSHNIPLAFGTDYPVESVNPFRGLYAAITRMNDAGTKTYEPQEKLTLDEAIYAYTQGSAYADFREKEKGRLEPGFLADFIILDRDITKATPQDLLHTKVLQTIVNGQPVYTAPK
jgi:predicted amidohydrolase YtcJ